MFFNMLLKILSSTSVITAKVSERTNIPCLRAFRKMFIYLIPRTILESTIVGAINFEARTNFQMSFLSFHSDIFLAMFARDQFFAAFRIQMIFLLVLRKDTAASSRTDDVGELTVDGMGFKRSKFSFPRTAVIVEGALDSEFLDLSLSVFIEFELENNIIVISNKLFLEKPFLVTIQITISV